MKQQFKKSERININKLRDQTTQNNYPAVLKQKLTQNHKEYIAQNKAWKTVAMTYKEKT